MSTHLGIRVDSSDRECTAFQGSNIQPIACVCLGPMDSDSTSKTRSPTQYSVRACVGKESKKKEWI